MEQCNGLQAASGNSESTADGLNAIDNHRNAQPYTATGLPATGATRESTSFERAVSDEHKDPVRLRSRSSRSRTASQPRATVISLV